MENQLESFRDTLDNLKSQRDVLKEQLKNINAAIDALEKVVGVSVTQQTKPQRVIKRRKKVAWISHIRELFKEQDNLTLKDVQDALIEMGVEAAVTPRGRSAINTTLGRMVDDNDELDKNEETGVYSNKKKEGLTFDVQ